MRCALADHVSRTAGAGHCTAESGAFIDHHALEHELISGKAVIVLGIGYSSLQRLVEEVGTLLRSVAEHVRGLGYGHPLNGGCYVAHLLRRDASVLVY